MNKIKYLILMFGMVAGLGLTAVPSTVGASTAISAACQGEAANTAICKDNNDSDKTVKNFIKVLVNTLLYVLGAVSVIVIIMSGIFYTVSGGDATAVTKAKNTLMYAVVGLIVAVLSGAIVNFVLLKLL